MTADRAKRGATVSTVLGRRLGGELLLLRERLGLRQSHAAEALSASVAKVAKMENGLVPMRDPDIQALCRAYGVSDPEAVGRLCELARLDRERRKVQGRWSRTETASSAALREYLAMEEVAIGILNLELSAIPGLLQTPEYVRALLQGGPGREPAEREAAVEIRLKRQQRLTGEHPVALDAVVWEGALRQLVGGAETMRGQLGHLLDVSRQENISLRVVPFRAGAAGCPVGPFTILSFAPAESIDVVYADGVESSFVAENRHDSAAYRNYFGAMSGAALDAGESRSLLDDIRKETSR
ncbi:DUF5753 domain-containing protein [Streptomyces avicenniae]|uniref:DUF5753 domain-containing protein n=1 Tax=Streptomyces avicenniae TaxID=500153 RepID=UPI00069C83AA|nr:DUF5753 domain-containing protein [Streptomyces avicenniae]